MTRIGYFLLLLYLVFLFARPTDFVPELGRFPRVILALTALTTIASGRIFRAVASQIGQCWFALGGWMVLTAPFSVWPTGALRYAAMVWGRTLIVFIAIVSYVTNLKKMHQTLWVALLCLQILPIISLVQRAEIAGRLAGEHSFGDPNELAMITLLADILWIYFFSRRRQFWWVRLAALAAVSVNVITLFMTGSRAGVTAAVIVGAYGVWRLPWKWRIPTVAAAAALAFMALALAPATATVRYRTILSSLFSSDSNSIRDSIDRGRYETEAQRRAEGSAAASSSARLYLLSRSLELTLGHPIVGVGAGMFRVAENAEALDQGLERGTWQVSHNMYTQASSELGFPGLAIFLTGLFLVWRASDRVEKRTPSDVSRSTEIRRLASFFKCLLLTFFVVGLTLSIAFGPYLGLLTGFVVALRNISLSAVRARDLKKRADSIAAGRRASPAAPRPSALRRLIANPSA